MDPAGEIQDSDIAIITKVIETLGHTLEITPSAEVVNDAHQSAEVPHMITMTESQATTDDTTDEVKTDTAYGY